jgi:parvulin-like peptidyl-prolyl isomerase
MIRARLASLITAILGAAVLSAAVFGAATPAPALAQSPAAPPAHPPGTALVVDGTPIGVPEYDAWLLREYGAGEAPGHAVQIALEHEAARLGLPVDDLMLRLRLDREIDARIAAAHGGVKARWLEELAVSGLSENGFRIRRSLELRGDMLAESIALATRKLTKELVQREFERRYGKSTRFLRVQILRVDLKFPPAPPGATGEQVLAERQRIVEQTKARMNLYRQQVKNGESFAEIAKANSDDAATREKGGVMDEPLRLEEWPENVVLAISFLGAGELSPVMRVDSSFVLMRALESRMIDLESEKEALLAYLRDAPPDAQEVSAVRERAGGNLSPELLPALTAPFDAAHPRDPEEVVMRTRGVEVSRRAFGAWLRARLGEERAARFAGERAVLRDAAAAGITVDDAEIEQCVAEEMQRVLVEDFGGNVARKDAALKAHYGDEARWKRELDGRWRLLRPLERLMMQRRVIEETTVRVLHEDRYGPGGEGLVVRWIFLRPPPMPSIDANTTVEAALQKAAEQRAVLEKRARALVERARSGADFAELARAESDDGTTRALGGRIPGHVVPERYAGDKRKALAALEVGGVSDPVAERGGFAIYKLDARGAVEYASVAAELRKELESRRPDAGELATELRRYETAAKIERGPDLLR